MNENPFLSMAFGSPKILFNDLVKNNNQISANQDGVITFAMILNARPMPFRFNATEKKMAQ